MIMVWKKSTRLSVVYDIYGGAGQVAQARHTPAARRTPSHKKSQRIDKLHTDPIS